MVPDPAREGDAARPDSIFGRVEFAGGWREVALTCLRAVRTTWTRPPPRLSAPDSALAVVRRSPRLLQWHASVGAFPLGTDEKNAALVSLAETLDGVARDVAPELFGTRPLRYEVGNVISRDFTNPKVCLSGVARRTVVIAPPNCRHRQDQRRILYHAYSLIAHTASSRNKSQLFEQTFSSVNVVQ